MNVNEFLKFNKIKILLDRKGIGGAEVARAAKDSELLEVSSDMTKVRRNLEKFPVKEKDQQVVDDCTIYVQVIHMILLERRLSSSMTEIGCGGKRSVPGGIFEFTTERTDFCFENFGLEGRLSRVYTRRNEYFQKF